MAEAAKILSGTAPADLKYDPAIIWENDCFNAKPIAGQFNEPDDFLWRLWRIEQNNHVILQVKDTVACLIYNPDRQAVALVGQKRPAVSLKNGGDGFLLEVPAGHVENQDIDNPRAAMAREANEELGAKFDLDGRDFGLIGDQPLFLSPGHLTERMWLGYAEAGDEKFDQAKCIFGLTDEGEETERVWTPIYELDCLDVIDMKTFALIQWFLYNHQPAEGAAENADHQTV